MWLDNASDVDILFYEPYARIIADIAKNKEYNPLTIGVFGLCIEVQLSRHKFNLFIMNRYM